MNEPTYAEQAAAIRAAQDRYLASQQAQDERRDIVYKAATVWQWPIRSSPERWASNPGP